MLPSGTRVLNTFTSKYLSVDSMEVALKEMTKPFDGDYGAKFVKNIFKKEETFWAEVKSFHRST